MASTSSTYGSSSSIEDIKGRARQTIDAASEAAGDAKQQVEEMAGNVKGAIDKSVKDQPLTTLLIAGAVGFVVGALWKS
ncbi:conserved hypothetical protein [Hyphomicrobium sp. GJ21]|mgnify:CR=1|jgi:ElaB/YqjD/DUF883 family membrane-anchored ribosome-binding protein|uniref:DUF883 domain-containing protein n=1 Tax=Hyphomicrobium denitrificans (strain ATCC 51888 / DSM 1869 / NCIMB 11706 / TK 0415) TaxID=582899 RepID=D8JYM1_HYPDA|nr:MULTISPECIES: DUF883 family protein [Hyphomicrobium]ADJ23473.1 protein of unknown function DUF883 ElaB [Hyphomicrobium denitrificans ATCC 51888]MBN9289658.1 DUF883 family protein [Hyphomicrobium denitrificans]CEJ85053.1 conserved hypothetical protein [Hyphomicrobium sp. GJ21]